MFTIAAFLGSYGIRYKIKWWSSSYRRFSFSCFTKNLVAISRKDIKLLGKDFGYTTER